MNQEKIGKFISICRKELNLTQKEFADKLGVTDKTVSRWENGHYLPDISLYKEICEILNISILELMDGEKITKDKKILEKVDDIFIRNVEEINKKNKRDRLYIISCVASLIVLFVLFTMNAYRELRMFLIIATLMTFIGIFFLTHKTLYKKYIIIPFIIIITLFSFDYIAISNYQVEPILAINTENATSNETGIIYRKYRGLFYTAYKCAGSDIYEIGENTEVENYCWRYFYERDMFKAATLQSEEGYIYYMQLAYNSSKKGNVIAGVTAFNLETVFEMISDNPLISDEKQQEKHRNQLKGPMGDCCDTSYAPKEIQQDLDAIFSYIYNNNFEGEISLKDLENIKVTNINKKDIVTLYNKVLNEGINIESSDNGYAMYRKKATINNVDYQLCYFTLDKNIKYADIIIKNNKINVDENILEEIESNIIKNNSFKISDINKNKDYTDLYRFLSNIPYKEE